MRRWGIAVTLGLGVFLGAVAPALAADFYVDIDAPAGSATCTFALPCDTIAEGIALADASDLDADTVHVGRSTNVYMTTATIPDTPMTLIGGDYNVGTDGPTTIIDGNAAAGVSFTFADGTPRTVSGLTVRGGDGGPNQSLNGGGTPSGITVMNNTFDEAAPALAAHISLHGSSQIIGNTIDGTDNAGDSTLGISVDAGPAGAPVISGNTIDGVERSISISGTDNTTITVAENDIEVDGDDGSPEVGILLTDAVGVVRDNLITADASPGEASNGIQALGDTPGTLQLLRNEVYGLSGVGVLLNTTDPVTMNGDVIAFNDLDDTISAGVDDQFGPASLTISNATLFNNGTLGEVRTADPGSVTLDSTIVGPQGVQSAGGTPTCTASFSRGPATGLPCGYATAASPSFSSFALDGTGFHLTANNPALIDMGNPGAAAGTDRDGDSLLLDGLANGACLPRRDIGADEVPGLSTDCPPPAPTALTPATAVTGQRAAALKRCKKKKTARARKKCRKRARKLPV